jgi:hypothetical protein
MLERLPEQVMTLAWLLEDSLADARKADCPRELVTKLEAMEKAVKAMLETAKLASVNREHKYLGRD